MKPDSVKRHLKPYEILRQRRTTINHAFAAAIAPCDSYDLNAVGKALAALGQNLDEELKCVYCDAPAETWDHVLATVKNSVFSGAGHRISNLVPCCKPCNSAKGNKDWQVFLSQRDKNESTRAIRLRLILAHISSLPIDRVPIENPDYVAFMEINAQVLKLLGEADSLAKKIRDGEKRLPSPEK